MLFLLLFNTFQVIFIGNIHNYINRLQRAAQILTDCFYYVFMFSDGFGRPPANKKKWETSVCKINGVIMILAIMQPYFLPYIGYWQLLNAADKFVVYDDIEYTKKGWINRNRILVNGKDSLLSIPLKKDSDHLFVCNRQIADNFQKIN